MTTLSVTGILGLNSALNHRTNGRRHHANTRVRHLRIDANRIERTIRNNNFAIRLRLDPRRTRFVCVTGTPFPGTLEGVTYPLYRQRRRPGLKLRVNKGAKIQRNLRIANSRKLTTPRARNVIRLFGRHPRLLRLNNGKFRILKCRVTRRRVTVNHCHRDRVDTHFGLIESSKMDNTTRLLRAAGLGRINANATRVHSRNIRRINRIGGIELLNNVFGRHRTREPRNNRRNIRNNARTSNVRVSKITRRPLTLRLGPITTAHILQDVIKETRRVDTRDYGTL